MPFKSLTITATTVLFCFAAWAKALEIDLLGQFGPGQEDSSEIAAYDPLSKRLFVTNSAANTVDVYDFADPAAVTALTPIAISALNAGEANSVASHNGLVAVAVAAANAQDTGVVAFYDSNGNLLKQVTVGALPDMVTFSPDGNWALVANEGEPDDDYTVDPPGSVSLIDLSGGVANASVSTLGFDAFNAAAARAEELPGEVRIFGPGASVADDMEPEYIAVSADSMTAYVTLQENNAVAVIDLANQTISSIIALGFKDHNLANQGMDASDEDNAINIRPWPVMGLYLPDAIDVYQVDSQPYFVTANEGDARDYNGFSEEARVEDLTLDSAVFSDAALLQAGANLGRLKVTTTLGDDDKDGDYERLFSYGARSFSIWNGQDGRLVFDSGDDFEQITAQRGLPLFNADDSRSDDKGPEPEAIVIGVIGNTPYAFIGLERTGGFLVYDISNPNAPVFVHYEASASGDVAPEGLLFIGADESPNQQPLLVISHEVSGTLAAYRIDANALFADDFEFSQFNTQ